MQVPEDFLTYPGFPANITPKSTGEVLMWRYLKYFYAYGAEKKGQFKPRQRALILCLLEKCYEYLSMLFLSSATVERPHRFMVWDPSIFTTTLLAGSDLKGPIIEQASAGKGCDWLH